MGAGWIWGEQEEGVEEDRANLVPGASGSVFSLAERRESGGRLVWKLVGFSRVELKHMRTGLSFKCIQQAVGSLTLESIPEAGWS